MDIDISEELFHAIDEIVKVRLAELKTEITQELKDQYQTKQLLDAGNYFDTKTIESALQQIAQDIKKLNM